MSEESGVTGDGEYTVVVDPIDGSTNCDRGIPFYSTSLAVLRDHELVGALVRNQVTGTVYVAEQGSGAQQRGQALVRHHDRGYAVLALETECYCSA